MIKPRLIATLATLVGLGAGYALAQGPMTKAVATKPAASVTATATLAAATKPLYQMSKAEIDAWLTGLKGKSLTQRMEAVSGRALNTPYFLGPLGEGTAAPFDKKPLIDLSRVDCVTFCEQTLALSLAKSYDQAYEVLQKIRYKGGHKTSERLMETRNHYFMADWVPNNQWLVSDVTPSLPHHTPLTRTISHRKLFESQGFKGITVREPDRTLTIQYVPDSQLSGVEKQLKSGDIGVLIQDHEGIFAAHTGMMYKLADGRWVFRNATSLDPKKVVDTPWPELIASLQKSKRLIGMSFVRPRQQP